LPSSPDRRRRSRRHRSPVVDVHAHYFPESFLRLIERDGAGRAAGVDRSDRRGPVLRIGAVRVGPLTAGFRDLEARVAAMDRQGVDVQALSLTHPMVYWAGAALGGALARAMNDALAEAHARFPRRLVGLATLPLQDPPAAVAELDRAAALPGIRGVYLGTNVNGRDLSDAAFLPVWQRIAEHALPVFLHPLDVIGADRLRPFYLDYLLGNCFDTAVAAAHLVFGGVLDRFPRLTVCLAHGGGALPYLIGRLDRGWRVRPELRALRRAPSAYLRRFTYDTITHAAPALRYLVGLVGADRVLMGSDYCFPLGDERPAQVTAALRLPPAPRAAILGGTAARLLGLGRAAPGVRRSAVAAARPSGARRGRGERRRRPGSGGRAGGRAGRRGGAG
jgi:aminocarboxymuconate-semialdehyde decarboxylase